MIHVRRGNDRSSVVLDFSGPLDLRAVEDLASIVLQQPESLHVIIDISQASSVHDSALGRLVDVLPRVRSHSFRGAGSHQARLLHYLGESTESGGEELSHTD